MFNRKMKDGIAVSLTWLASGISIGVLVAIIVFIFSNGWSLISTDFLRNNHEDIVSFINFTTEETFSNPGSLENDALFSENTGIAFEYSEGAYIVTWIDENSPANEAVDNEDNLFPVEKGQHIEDINGMMVTANTTATEVLEALNGSNEMVLMVRIPGGGVFPMIVSTVMLVVLTLAIAATFGILAAIYMVEYAKPGRIVSIIRFATEILTGIPSVVYGLFGMLMFVQLLNLGMSILSGALTMSILLLPIMMRTTEEALKSVPMSYREASYGLAANKIQTIYKVVLPSAMPGIVTGIILSTGRIVGESAALMFTVGTFASMPMNPATGHLSFLERGATLTLRAFISVREFGDVQMASAIGIVILVIVFSLNIISRLVLKKFSRANY